MCLYVKYVILYNLSNSTCRHYLLIVYIILALVSVIFMDYICARNECTSSASILPARLTGKKETRNKDKNNIFPYEL